MIVTIDKIDTSKVTPSQIGKCYKVIGSDGRAFYQVESESEPVEYKVTWDRAKGFQCTCEAGKQGFRYCYKQGVCKHVVWAVAAKREELQAVAEIEASVKQQAAPVLSIDGRAATELEYKRVMQAPAKPVERKAQAPQYKPFSLLK